MLPNERAYMAKMLAKQRTTFYIDGELHRKLNISAVTMVPKRSMSEIVESLIRQFLDSSQGDVARYLPAKPVSRIKVN
jgi:hypothetical protein